MTAARIAMIGDGKMGKAIAGMVRDASSELAVMIGAGMPITRDSLNRANVAIEFTEPSAAVANAKACIDAGCPVVIGTTGWYAQKDELTRYAREHNGTLLWAANFSLGVHLFAELARYAGQLMSRVPTFDAHMTETHHTAKKDAPSGTALMLRDAAAPTLGRDIPITSIRVGSVPGTHELIFDATYEQITLTHTARDRRVFAEGAIAAAQWLADQAPGVYTLADMLGTKDS